MILHQSVFVTLCSNNTEIWQIFRYLLHFPARILQKSTVDKWWFCQKLYPFRHIICFYFSWKNKLKQIIFYLLVVVSYISKYPALFGSAVVTSHRQHCICSKKCHFLLRTICSYNTILRYWAEISLSVREKIQSFNMIKSINCQRSQDIKDLILLSKSK